MIDIILAIFAGVLTLGLYFAKKANRGASLSGLMLLLVGPATVTAMGQGLTMILFAYCMGTGMVLFLMWMFQGV